MRDLRKLLPALAAAATLGLAGCGGGGGSSSGSSGGSSSTSQSGTVNLSLTDGPSDEFQHVWVTVTAVSFHTDPNATWSASDATWQTTTLAAPVTIDLASLNNGSLNSQVFAGLTLPAGSYQQIRLFLDSAQSTLAASALATSDSTGAALQWNDQVEYLSSTGAVTEAPLEIAYPVQGIQLVGSFNVTQGGTLDIAVDFDLEHDVVAFNHDSMTYFTMRPDLRYFNLPQSAAITGQVDPSKLCASVQAQFSQTSAAPCAYNVIVKAEHLTADGSRHAVYRETMVNPATGDFTLYPLATQDASGNAISSYDIVIRGRNMETLLVTGVPVTAGTVPGGSGGTAPTSVQSGAIGLTLNAGEYTAQFATALAPLTSGYAIFQQTLPGSGAVPYEIRWRNTDPFTGYFRNPIALQGSSSSLHVGPYNSGNSIAFTPVTPAEGAGAFTVADNEAAYYTLSPGTVMQPPTAPATTQTFTPQLPTLDSGILTGSVNVTLDFSGLAIDNECEFVIERFATIINSYDCNALLVDNTPESFTVGNLPAGSTSDPVAGAYYYAYVRLWEAGHGRATRLVVPLPGMIDLRETTSTTISGSIPGA